jgi:hypothetical protein
LLTRQFDIENINPANKQIQNRRNIQLKN